MHESHKTKLVFMETYIYQLETMSPAPALSSLPVDGEASSSPHQAHKEKRKGGKRGGTIKLSTEPQSIAARQRRHRISDRFKILKSLVPGGSKMDTVSMLEEAIHYVKFLKTQIWLHQAALMAPPFPFSCSNTTVITNGDIHTTIDASPFPSSSSPVLPSNHQIVSYSLPPPSSPLPPLPFKGEEEMLSYVGLNY